MDNGENRLEMGTGGDFGDDSAIFFKNVDLGNDDVREELIVGGF